MSCCHYSLLCCHAACFLLRAADHGLFVLFNCYFHACSGNNGLEQIEVGNSAAQIDGTCVAGGTLPLLVHAATIQGWQPLLRAAGAVSVGSPLTFRLLHCGRTHVPGSNSNCTSGEAVATR